MAGTSGFKNFGNTCFINSALQVLVHTDDLNRYFLGQEIYQDLDENKPEYPIIIAYQTLVQSYWNKELTTNISKDLINLIKVTLKHIKEFRLGLQQDSQELLIKFIDLMHQGLLQDYTFTVTGTIRNSRDEVLVKSIGQWKDYLKQDGFSIFTDLFYGQLHTKVRCHDCGNITHKFDPFCYLELALKTNGGSLQELVDLFCNVEELSDSNQYECEENCKKMTNATKTLNLFRLPKHLIVHLKRFDFTTGRSRKNTAQVDFPVYNFSLDHVVDPLSTQRQTRYHLYAVINHSGGPNGGHYYCYGKVGHQWFNFNDCSVNQIDQSQIVSRNGYVLFYQLEN